MVNDITVEYQLPGAYHYQRRPSDKEDNNNNTTVSLPLAIVSSVLFPSEGIMFQTTHTSLPGAWVKEQDPSQYHNNIPTHITTTTTTIPSPSSSIQQVHEPIEQPPEKENEQEQESTSTTVCNKVEYNNQVDALRRTVAELRRKAEQLEQADVMVKKGIEIVARKRVIAQHKRRRQSEWDWCDSHSSSSSDNDDDEDDVSVTRQRRPNKKKPLIFVDDEGGEWEVI